MMALSNLWTAVNHTATSRKRLQRSYELAFLLMNEAWVPRDACICIAGAIFRIASVEPRP